MTSCGQRSPQFAGAGPVEAGLRCRESHAFAEDVDLRDPFDRGVQFGD